jgi:uncharacterized membrane-anchored protein
MNRLRSALIVAGLALVLAAANRDILHKRATVAEGRPILLQLRPVDPRSLMAGDYMMLRYAADAFPDSTTMQSMPHRGTVIMALDADGVGRFVRLDDGATLATNELRLGYKHRSDWGELRYGAESFFFQEGMAARYADAKYGVLRVDANGSSVLVGLADANRQPIDSR